MNKIEVRALGQSGYLFECGSFRFAVDPYLSDYVEKNAGPAFKRLSPPVLTSEQLGKIDALFITHAHWDHCDPDTIGPIFRENPEIKIICTYECVPVIRELGARNSNIILATENLQEIVPGIRWRAIPAAHTQVERNADGHLKCVAYYWEIHGKRVYHAGDAIPDKQTLAALPKNGIDLAFVPVNERNCYRDDAGIIGNMTVREALQWVEDIGAKKWTPMHWDTFPLNRTYPEEVNFLAEKMGTQDKIHWLHAGETLQIPL